MDDIIWGIILVVFFTAIARLFIVQNIRGKAVSNALTLKYGGATHKEAWRQYRSISYDKMIWSLHKWTFKQFYGDLKEK